MRTTLIVLLAFFTTLTCLAMDWIRKTVTLRYQPPIAVSTPIRGHGLICEKEVTRAYRMLKPALRKVGLGVQLGTFRPANGPGRLWIDGHPLEEWLAKEKTDGRCVYCGQPLALEAPGCTVKSEQIVQAALMAGANLISNGTVANLLFTDSHPRARPLIAD